MKAGVLILVVTGLLLVVAYKRSGISTTSDQSSQHSEVTGVSAARPASVETPGGEDSAQAATSSYSYSVPPQVNAGMSIDEAYAAIPHRRTPWRADGTTVPAGEREYLNAMFQVLDQAVVSRSAGIQNYSRKDFDSFNAEAALAELTDYVGKVQVPPSLADYNNRILAALSGEKQFFQDWKHDPDRFDYMKQVETHQGVSQSSAALRAAYQDLISRYPRESQANQDAFFDYHCAADFR